MGGASVVSPLAGTKAQQKQHKRALSLSHLGRRINGACVIAKTSNCYTPILPHCMRGTRANDNNDTRQDTPLPP